MSDEEDEKVEVQVVVAGHGGLRVDSLTGQRKGGRKTNAEWNAKEPPPKGQLSLTAFAARTQNKKPKMMATEGAMEVEGVEMTTFSSTITTNTSTSGRTPASAIATLPVTSSSGSTSKRQRGIGGDGVGGYHHEVLLPPSKDAAKGASGVEALSGAEAQFVFQFPFAALGQGSKEPARGGVLGVSSATSFFLNSPYF